MVHTEEFTNRLGGDSVAAEAAHAGVEVARRRRRRRRHRLRARCAGARETLDLVTMRPVAQSAQHLPARGSLRVRPADDDGPHRRARRGWRDRPDGRRRSRPCSTTSLPWASVCAARCGGARIFRTARTCSGRSGDRSPMCGFSSPVRIPIRPPVTGLSFAVDRDARLLPRSPLTLPGERRAIRVSRPPHGDLSRRERSGCCCSTGC